MFSRAWDRLQVFPRPPPFGTWACSSTLCFASVVSFCSKFWLVSHCFLCVRCDYFGFVCTHLLEKQENHLISTSNALCRLFYQGPVFSRLQLVWLHERVNSMPAQCPLWWKIGVGWAILLFLNNKGIRYWEQHYLNTIVVIFPILFVVNRDTGGERRYRLLASFSRRDSQRAGIA